MNNETAYEFQSKCRVCLCQVVKSVNIFEVDPQCGKISVALVECTCINIEVGDCLPTIICAECLENLQKCFEFRLLCQMSDQTMRHYLNFITNDVAEPLLLAPLDINPEIKTEPLITPEPFDPLSLNPFRSPAPNIEEIEETYEQEMGVKEEEINIKEEKVHVDDRPEYTETMQRLASNFSEQIEETGEKLVREDEEKMDDIFVKTEVMIVQEVLDEFVCNACNKPYQTEAQLNRHKTVVHGERRFSCDVCSRKFKESGVLKLHKMAIHNGIRPHRCQFCEKGYTSINHLRRHLRTHFGERQYKCNECDKIFSQRKELVSHCKMEHENLNQFECNLCDKSFKLSIYLENHNERFHKSGYQKNKKIQCENCLKIFKTMMRCKFHQIRFHQKEPPYFCPLCNTKALRKVDIRRHMEVFHVNKRPAVKVSKSEVEAALKQINSKNLKRTKKKSLK